MFICQMLRIKLRRRMLYLIKIDFLCILLLIQIIFGNERLLYCCTLFLFSFVFKISMFEKF